MFNEYPEIMGQMETKSCKPDPEEMLQRSRKRIEECDKALNMLFSLSDMRVDIYFGRENRDASLCAIGHLVVQKRDAEKEQEHWLKEIDKE